MPCSDAKVTARGPHAARGAQRPAGLYMAALDAARESNGVRPFEAIKCDSNVDRRLIVTTVITVLRLFHTKI